MAGKVFKVKETRFVWAKNEKEAEVVFRSKEAQFCTPPRVLVIETSYGKDQLKTLYRDQQGD